MSARSRALRQADRYLGIEAYRMRPRYFRLRRERQRGMSALMRAVFPIGTTRSRAEGREVSRPGWRPNENLVSAVLHWHRQGAFMVYSNEAPR